MTVPAADQDTETDGGKALSRPKARRWLVRLSMAAEALLVLYIAGLAALIVATSGPQIQVARPNE